MRPAPSIRAPPDPPHVGLASGPDQRTLRSVSQGRLRVVVADNDRDALDLIATDLALEGHDIVGRAADGENAVALCGALAPDVLVTDYRMAPGIDGVAVARRLLRGLPGIRVIVYSNYRDPAIARAAERTGALFLEKGNLAALRRAVRGEQVSPTRRPSPPPT